MRPSRERIVIVGAGPAGLSAARAYRDCGGTGSVTLVGDEPVPPYRRPPLTKEFLRGEIGRDDLALASDAWFSSQQVELRLGHPVVEIDARRGVVRTTNGPRLPATACVLTTGSQPTRPPIPGADHPQVLTLRRADEAERLGQAIHTGTRVTVIGSGFIGCEAACSLVRRGARVTLVSPESLPQIERLGGQVAERIAAWLADCGVELLLGAKATGIEDARRVSVDGRADVEADLVLLGTGVSPRSDLAEACGLDLRDGAITVDGSLRASDGFFLAAGDVACAHNAAAGRHLRVEHWGDALGQGAIAGQTLAGRPSHWNAVPGFWTTIGDRTLKYAAWGDGFDELRFEDGDDGAFTVSYLRGGRPVGVLTHDQDAAYEHGRELIGAQGSVP